MALTGKSESQFGWQRQAQHLALTHTPMGVAAMTLAKKTRERAFASTDLPRDPDEDHPFGAEPSPLNQPANDFRATSEKDLQTQLARQKLVGRQLRECIEALSRRAEDAEKRYADLEDEMNVAREEILLQQNDKHSLQTSLDSLASENARLTGRLNESDATLEQARNQIEHGKAALDLAKRAHDSLSAAVGEANGKQLSAANKLEAVKFECRNLTAALGALQRKHQIEGNNLKAVKIERNKLVAALDRAHEKTQTCDQKLKALQTERDRLAAVLGKSNQRRRTEIDELKTRLDAATSRAATAENLVAKVREVLLEKFSQLQASVETKNCEVHDLERSRLRLIDGTKMLLEIFAMRDVALARADARIRFLSDRIAELEAEAYRSGAWRRLDAVDGLGGRFLDHDLADSAIGRADPRSIDDAIDGSATSELPPLYLASAMLAETVSF